MVMKSILKRRSKTAIGLAGDVSICQIGQVMEFWLSSWKHGDFGFAALE